MEHDGHEDEQRLEENRSSVSEAARGGMRIKEPCRKGGRSDATLSKWRRSTAKWSRRMLVAA